MKILMLSTDENIFKENSGVLSRILDYGKLVEELHIVIKSSQKINKVIGNIFLYSTNSFGLFYFWNAYIISKKILVASGQWLITSQDPFETGLVGYLLKLYKKIPLQLQIHTDFLSPYFWRESFKNKIRVILGKWLVKKANGLRVVSERIKNSIIKNCKLKIENSAIAVLPIVYDMNRFNEIKININLHKKYCDYDFIILVASRLTIEKNIIMAIDAMSKVVEVNPKALLLIVGEGYEKENLKSQISNLNLENNTVFEPWTNDMASYYRTADVFVLTSNYEGGARSPAEAIASGLPVVMTDVAPANETIINNVNGFVVPIGKSGILADKILELMFDTEKRIKFKQNALSTAKDFISKDEYMKCYKNALTSVIS